VTTPPSDQTYDIGTLSGFTSYNVPQFITNPSGVIIAYTDVSTAKPSDIKFSWRAYDWSLLKTPGTYTLTIKGSISASTTVTASFKLEIT
jgi:hypothetical protein